MLDSSQTKHLIKIERNIPGLYSNYIKFKPLDYGELSVIFERLIRFSPPFSKLERILRESLSRNITEPKISVKNFSSFQISTINSLFQILWDESLKIFFDLESCNYSINGYMAYEEMKSFNVNEFLKNIFGSCRLGSYKPETGLCAGSNFPDESLAKDVFFSSGLINKDFFEDLKGFSVAEKLFMGYRMNFPINISSFLKFLQDKEKISEEVKRLIKINNILESENFLYSKENFENIFCKALDYRRQNGCVNPPELLILVEGLTEEVLLPVFSKFAGIDFSFAGIKTISAGGKNQSLKLYKILASELNIPVLILLDSDAENLEEAFKKVLKDQDDIYIISSGEFEDVLPENLICRAVNSHYRLTGKILFSEIISPEKKSRILPEIWQEKGFGEFKKAEFAKLLAGNILGKEDLSEELEIIFEKIKNMTRK